MSGCFAWARWGLWLSPSSNLHRADAAKFPTPNSPLPPPPTLLQPVISWQLWGNSHTPLSSQDSAKPSQWYLFLPISPPYFGWSACTCYHQCPPSHYPYQELPPPSRIISPAISHWRTLNLSSQAHDQALLHFSTHYSSSALPPFAM